MARRGVELESMPKGCPRDVSAFKKSVNMSPSEIRRWAKDPRALCASFAVTRGRLPALATLRAKNLVGWTANDCKFARRVVNFNKRMEGMSRAHGCTTKINVALRNWGRVAPGCGRVPECKRRRTL